MDGFLLHQTAMKSDRVLDATCGPVRGNIYAPTTGKRVLGYLGIPYAQPPVGSLRFKKPEPADKWVEPLDCYEYGPRCPQDISFPGIEYVNTEMNETRCLTVNVFTPEWNSEEFPSGRPVMVFVHCGAFESAADSDYCHTSLVGNLPVKDVVVVTMNYRVGIFGFLTTGDSTCPGNLGLWDQTLALKWVQSHIASFGGDPNNVTVFGESAGGCSTDLLSLSPHSRDLFKRGFLLSGTGDLDCAVRPRRYQARVCADYARFRGFDGSDTSAAILQWYQSQSSDALNLNIAEREVFEFTPVLDGDFFPKPLNQLRKDAGPRQIMVGTCEYEGLLVSAMIHGRSDETGLHLANEQRLRTLENGDDKKSFREKIKKFCLKDNNIADETTVHRQMLIIFGNDIRNVAYETVRKLAEGGSTVHFYEFCHFENDSLGNPNELLSFLGAAHPADSRYVLGEGMYSKLKETGEDVFKRDKIMTWWANFAKYGNPNGKVDGKWGIQDADIPAIFLHVGFPHLTLGIIPRDQMKGFLSHQTVIKSDEPLNATCGPVRGNIYEPTNGKRVFGYLGIPYAQPPVGNLRFKKPEPADKWVEPLDCYEYGPRCPQDISFPGIEYVNTEMDEARCLTVNVFTPEWKSEEFPSGRPVMVFVHGGAFEVGASSDYCDKSLAGSLPVKDVVVVTINYRVGIFGFLTTGDSTCPGNFGLWDQTLALKWVQSHIASFGGDPNNVTVFGESAGGCSTDLLSLSPHSRDLFKRGIAMSGTGDLDCAVRPWSYQASVCADYARFRGFDGPDTSAAILQWYQSQTSEALKWSVFPPEGFNPAKRGVLELIPVLDGDFFPKPLNQLRKDAGPRQMMIGACEYEGLLVSAMFHGLSAEKAFDLSNERRLSTLEYGDEADSLREEVKHFYFKNVDTTNDTAIRRQLVILCGDDISNATYESVTKWAQIGSTVYFYELCHFEKDSFGNLNDLFSFQGATHATDLRYVMGEGVYSKFVPTENDLIVHDKMTTWWTNFAKYGNPNGKTDGSWEKYSIEHPSRYFHIGLPSSFMKEPYQDNRYEKLWRHIREKDRSKAQTY